MALTPPLIDAAAAPDIAIRLAAEGVPLCAIARATRIPSAELREQLEAAREEGWLIELPCHDWPPGPPAWHPRSPAWRGLAGDRDQQIVVLRALRALLGTTRSEGRLLLALLQTDSVCKDRYATRDIVNVHIHHLRRRLAPFGISIATEHGYGYRLSSEGRSRLMDMITEKIDATTQEPGPVALPDHPRFQPLEGVTGAPG
jgi:hypothetical protein